MKKIIWALTLCFVCASLAQADLIVGEDFDGISTWSNDFASQAFEDPTDDDEGLFVGDNSANGGLNIGSGNTALGRDLEGEGDEPSLDPYLFTFDSVDTSAYTNVVLSFDAYAFANVDAGSYEIIIDGVGQGPVEWYNDPDTTPTILNLTENIGTANTVGLVLTGTLNAANDVIEFDNFQLNGTAVPEPTAAILFGLAGLGLCVVRRRS